MQIAALLDCSDEQLNAALVYYSLKSKTMAMQIIGGARGCTGCTWAEKKFGDQIYRGKL